MHQNILMFVFLVTITSVAQQKQIKNKLELSGIVSNYDNKPIKGVFIYIDSTKTKVKTDKIGYYNILVPSESKLITAFSIKHGFIDIDYEKQNKINFIFPKNNQVISRKEFKDLGYSVTSNSGEIDYSGYTDIFQLLRTRFQNVEVRGETVRVIGSGATINGGVFTPIYLVNGIQVNNISNISPVDIKNISVERANTSLYGSRGAGGVIKIELK